jgi:lysophospholipase L1-like esterase
LAFQAAIALSQSLQRPVAWQLIAKSGVNTAQAHELFDTTSTQPADAVLFGLGVNDATSQVTAARFIEDSAALWQAVRAKTGARIAVFSGLPPVHQFPALPQPLRFYLGAWAKWLDQSLQRWTQHNKYLYCPIAATLGNASVADMAGDGYHPGPRIYAAWGQQAAQLIATRIQAEHS